MTFTSFEFLILTIFGLFAYYLLSGRFRWICLLIISIAFYAYGSGTAIVWLLSVSAVSWLSAVLLHRLELKLKALSTDEKKKKEAVKRYKKVVCTVYLVAVFGLLFMMKYWNFTMDIIGKEDFLRVDYLIPLGLSFFIFQSAGYVIDVYRGKVAFEKNPLKVLLFTSFFPQMIQGPISRFDELSSELFKEKKFDWENIRNGLQLVMWGYFKKLIIADRAAVAVKAVFDDNTSYGGVFIAFSIFLYCIQLYCDFSGGIDIARGIAELFGISLTENFRRPFFATSLADYWRRWHISLGSWMRDYLFYPLALSKAFGKLSKWSRKRFPGKLGKLIPTSLATFIVYFVIGIWHGANFRYIAFGIWNGVIITASLLFEETFIIVRQKLRIKEDSERLHVFRIMRTLLIVFIGRYITRAPRFLTALSMLWTTVSMPLLHQLKDGTIATLGLRPLDYFIILVGMAVVLGIELYQEKGGKVRENLSQKSYTVQFLAILIPLLVLLFFGIMRGNYISSEFIYRQF